MRFSLRGLGFAVVMTIAMLAAQAIGLQHRVAHAPGLERSPDAQAHGDHGDAECRLYDQLAHGDALPLPAPVLASEPPMAPPVPTHAASRIAAQAAGALARGPPLIG